MQIDHIVIGVADLDVGIDQLESLTGIRAARGGMHPDLGTHNALISLGSGQYLELLAPRPGNAAAGPFGFLGSMSEPRPVTWAVATEDAAQTAGMLRARGIHTSEVIPGSRALPDGSVLRWKTFRLSEPSAVGTPFFIEWTPGAAHPSDAAPKGCALLGIHIVRPEPDQLLEIVRLTELDVTITSGSMGRMRVELKCPARQIALVSEAPHP